MQNTSEITPSWAERWVRFLDDGLRIPGTSIRLGADALLGFFVPALGDVASALMSASLFMLALQRRVPPIVLAQMLVNVGLDTLLGSIPVVGDLFDIIFKANRKNLTLIQRHNTPTSARSNFSSYIIVALAGLLLLAGVVAPVLFFWWLVEQI